MTLYNNVTAHPLTDISYDMPDRLCPFVIILFSDMLYIEGRRAGVVQFGLHYTGVAWIVKIVL